MTLSRPTPTDSSHFWMVQAVFDPDGHGGDFAYTIGLADRGFPELHMYARPSEGDDPGADWKFSPHDCVGILNELASLMARGELGVGSTLRREYDGGLAVVDYRVDPPGDRELLEAYGASPGADVLPVCWTLSRPPRGVPEPLSEEALKRCRERYDDLVAHADPGEWSPPGWELPQEPSFEPGQRFGPLTPLVLARGAQMSHADPLTLRAFLAVSVGVEAGLSLGWPFTRALAVARVAGRPLSPDSMTQAVDELLDGWSDNRRLRRRWQGVVDDLRREWFPELAKPDRQDFPRLLRGLLWRSVAACLAGEAVFDIADDELRLWAAGPWEAAAAVDGRPGPEWHASAPVLDRVRTILAGLSARDLLQIGELHSCMMNGPSQGSDRYLQLQATLGAAAVVTAAACPPVADLLCDAGVADQLEAQWPVAHLRGDWACFIGLIDWLDCLTSLLTHRARFAADDVATFAAAVQPALPRLRAALDQPL